MRIKLIILSLFSILLASCSSSVRFSAEKGGSYSGASHSSTSARTNTSKPKDNYPSRDALGETFHGYASFYGPEFEGRQTSNGDIYDGDKLTGAHQTIPFGSKVKVKNLKNGKETVIIINDRGPWKKGRILDLSRAAAEKLDMVKDGVVEIEATVIE